jgi:hypothetical protein
VIVRKVITVSLLVIFSSFYLSAVELYEGIIKLTVNEKTGSFSMYCLSDPETLKYQPLFNDKEARASFIAVNVDGTIYRLGQTNVFRPRVESINGNPVVVFESVDLSITETFTPVRTTGSRETNGIKITITIQNNGNSPVSAGLRMFLDTQLGEKNKDFHFITNRQMISKETLFNAGSEELFWVSKNENYSLMGSILAPVSLSGASSKPPDYVHFANWRRLYNVPWTLSYKPGRSFNYRPYSLRDSAVSYYWEPAQLEAGNSFSYSIYLATEDFTWYGLAQPTSGRTYSNANLLLMYQLQETLNKFINGQIYLDEYELDEIERTIDEIR